MLKPSCLCLFHGEAGPPLFALPCLRWIEAPLLFGFYCGLSNSVKIVLSIPPFASRFLERLAVCTLFVYRLTIFATVMAVRGCLTVMVLHRAAGFFAAISNEAFVPCQQGDCCADGPAPGSSGGSAEAGDPWPNEDDQPSSRGSLVVFRDAEERA